MDPDADPGGPSTSYILRIRICNTDATYYLAVTPILLIAGDGEVSGYRAPRGVGALLAGGGGRGRPLALRRGHFVVGLIKVSRLPLSLSFFLSKKAAGFRSEALPPLPFRQLLFLFVLSRVQAPCLLSLYHT